MIFEEKEITLKNGASAYLRTPEADEGPLLLDFLRTCCSETDFLLRTPEECTETDEDERRFIENQRSSENSMMIACFAGGKVAGNCQLSFNRRPKTLHRASVAIALRREYWNLGIGTAMFCEMIRLARERGVSQLELDFVEGNSRARGLYEKMGFKIVSRHPDAIKRRDGSFADEYGMLLKL